MELAVVGGGIGAPVVLGGIPLHVVATGGVLHLVEAAAQGDQLPLIVDQSQVHAILFCCDTQLLTAVGEAISTVGIGSNGPDGGIVIAGDRAAADGDIHAGQVVAGNGGSGQRLIVSGGVDDHLVAGFHFGNGRNGYLLSEVDADGNIRRGRENELVTGTADGSGAAQQLIAGDLIAGSRSCSDGAARHGNRTPSGIIGDCGDVIADRSRDAAGGAGVVGRDLAAEHHEGQLGVVHEHITGAGDGLNRIVSAQLPGVNGVFFHPLQQDITAFHNAALAPHIGGVAPADIGVEHDTGYIAVEVIVAAGLTVGVIVAGGLTVGGVATGGVFAGGGGTQHHDIVLVLTAQTLTIGPGMLSVPAALTPLGTDGVAGIERGDLAAAVLAIGVLIEGLGGIIAGLVAMIVGHEGLEGLVQGAGGHTAGGGRTGKIRQAVQAHIIVLIERQGVGGHKGGDGATAAPVIEVLTVVHIVDGGCLGLDATQRQQGQTQHQCHQKGQRSFCHMLHKKPTFLTYSA